MPDPLISIGIAFRNPGPLFRLAIQSVFAQTISDWELLLVDDGSTDGAVEFSQLIDDSRVRVFRDGLHRNLNRRLNQMVAEARGRFFFRMDADDIMHPERLRMQLDALIAKDSDTVVGSACYSIDKDSKVVGLRSAPAAQHTGFDARHSFVHPTVAATTEWFRRNPYSEHVLCHRSEDAELWCRTSDKTRFIVLPEPLLYYRELGHFSYDNYLGTTTGVLYLTRKHGGGALRYSYLLTRELSKFWLTSMLDRFGKANWIVGKRFQSIRPAERAKAERDLEAVMRQQLPLRQGHAAVEAGQLNSVEVCL